MAKVVITERLVDEINKKFKKDSVKIFELIYSLKQSPHKGKDIAHVGNILIKELRYKSFRFYFITDKFKIKILKKEELDDLLIKFIRMSDKKTQQKVIDEIKQFLRKFSDEDFVM